MLKAWHKSKIFLHVQNIQTLRMENLYFFQTLKQFEHIWFKLHMCDLKNIWIFENVALWKVHINVIKSLNAYYII